MTNLQELSDAIVAGHLEPAVELTRQALDEGVDPQSIISDYMIPAMQRIGQRFQEGKAFVPELLMAARAHEGRPGTHQTPVVERQVGDDWQDRHRHGLR